MKLIKILLHSEQYIAQKITVRAELVEACEHTPNHTIKPLVSFDRLRTSGQDLPNLFFKMALILCSINTCLIASAMHEHGMTEHAPASSTKPVSNHTIHHLDYAWANTNIKPSQPPSLTGKQMGVINTLGIQPLGYEMDGNVKVFRLIAQPVEQYITDGKPADYESLIPDKNKLPQELLHHDHIAQKIRAWGYNGKTPGPTIEVNEGDRVRIILKNELPEPTSIHWHGIELPNDQDGQAGFTEPPLMPGQTKQYEFTLYQSGTAFYHGELNLMKAVSYGLVGTFVIHPKKYDNPIDKQ